MIKQEMTKRMKKFLTGLSNLLEKYDATINGLDIDCYTTSDGTDEFCNVKLSNDIDSDFIKRIIEENDNE